MRRLPDNPRFGVGLPPRHPAPSCIALIRPPPATPLVKIIDRHGWVALPTAEVYESIRDVYPGYLKVNQTEKAVFLFDADADEAGSSYGFYYGEAFAKIVRGLPTFSEIDSRILWGDLTFHFLCYRVTEVSKSGERGLRVSSGMTQKPDYELLKVLIGDFVDAAQDQWNTLDIEHFTNYIGRGNIYAIFYNNLSKGLRLHIDQQLRGLRGYLGALDPDLANPLQRQIFFESLCKDAFLFSSQIFMKGEEWEDVDHFFVGADIINENGVALLDYESFEKKCKEFALPDKWNERGLISLARWQGKKQPRVHERLAIGLHDTLFQSKDFGAGTWQFDNLPNAQDEINVGARKLTEYLLNVDHPKGGSKAKFFENELAITSRDFLFLKAQLEKQLASVVFTKIGLDQHGVRFAANLPVIGRNERIATIETGWIMRKGERISLVTAFPGKKNPSLEQAAWMPPVVRLRSDKDAVWAEVFVEAHAEGLKAATGCVPTPMKVVGYPIIMEGVCGSAQIRVLDARRGFARWLIKTGKGSAGYKSGAYVYVGFPSQSMDRAVAYANAFGQVLRWNAIECQIESHID